MKKFSQPVTLLCSGWTDLLKVSLLRQSNTRGCCRVVRIKWISQKGPDEKRDILSVDNCKEGDRVEELRYSSQEA